MITNNLGTAATTALVALAGESANANIPEMTCIAGPSVKTYEKDTRETTCLSHMHNFSDGNIRYNIRWANSGTVGNIETVDAQYELQKIIHAMQINMKKLEMQIKLRECTDLPDGWDGDGGHAPARQDIDNAVAFIKHIPDSGILSAELMVAGDGDVGFEWNIGKSHLEIGFYKSEISFYGRTENGLKSGGDEVFRGDCPTELKKLMNIIV